MTESTPIPAPIEAGGSSEWEAWRERILAALDEDPVNEALLAHLLDRNERESSPEQRILAALTGLRLPAAVASRQLREALERRESWGRLEGRSAPVRLSLLDVLLTENRRSPDPLRLELRLSPAPVSRGVADPAHTATEGTALLSAVQGELRRARRFRQPAALLWLHLDAQAELEAQAGPASAERALAEVALLVKNEIRDVDWAARTTRGELVVFLAGTGRFGAVLVARRIRDKLATQRLPLAGGGAPATASIGVSAFPDDALFGPELLAAAQKAMFRARSEGGDGLADAGQPSARRLVRAPVERVRTVVRLLAPEDSPEWDVPSEGLVFASPVAYPVGGYVELECIEVAGCGRVLLTGRVVRLEERVGGGFDIGVACRLDSGEAALLRGEAVRTEA